MKLDNTLRSWEACLEYVPFKERKLEFWPPPSKGLLNLNADVAARGKPVQQVLEVSFANCNVLFMLFKNVDVNYSNEAEVITTLEVLRSFFVFITR